MRPERKQAFDRLPDWRPAVEAIAEPLLAAVRATAHDAGISERDLEKQMLLHLPRFSLSELVQAGIIPAEAKRLADRRLKLRAPFAHWADRPPIATFHKSEVRAAACDDFAARVIHERFHYLGSFRTGHHLALFASEQADVPMALVSLSRMDISHLHALYATAEERSEVRVVSRMFAFDWAPRNSISYLLGQAHRWIRSRWPEVRTLLTYLNPNLGFAGASYEASNWSEFVDAPARYAYLEGNYITFRRLTSLPLARRQKVSFSQYRLAPLKIFRYQLRPERALHGTDTKLEEFAAFAGAH